MPITPVQPAVITRYYQVGITQLLFVAAMANPATPTNSELNLGTALHRDLAAWTGWSATTAFIETPDIASRFTSRLPGRIKAEDSTLTFYEDKLQVDLRTLMPRDTIGYIVIANGGLASGKGDVFKVQVGSVSKMRSMDNAALIKFDYAILQQPNEDVTLPAT